MHVAEPVRWDTGLGEPVPEAAPGEAVPREAAWALPGEWADVGNVMSCFLPILASRAGKGERAAAAAPGML